MAKVKKAIKAVKMPKGANKLNKKKISKATKASVKEALKKNVSKAEAKGKERKKKIQEKPKPKPDPLRPSIIMQSIAETLQNVCIEGEFDLPSMLVRQLDKSHPDYNLGLHRKYYIPITTNVSYFDKTSEHAMQIFLNQATVISPALIGEGIPRREKEFDLPLCKDHE